MARCEVCYRNCDIKEGKLGFCKARGCRDGRIYAANYGKVTSLALDPIEKKPLNRYHAGSMILSVGSYGCNLRCPFCQNHEISWGREVDRWPYEAEELSPNELADIAEECKDRGNIGVAYTYNEPLVGYEYILDTARLIHDRGMVNVIVSNGMASMKVYEKLAPYIDAMNIDLKGFTDRYYKDVLQGDRDMVIKFITQAVKHCHVELTTLIIPGENDSEEEMRDISSWIAGLKDSNGCVIGEDIPLHISRFFPRYEMSDTPPTDVGLIYHLADVAREKLKFVYTGNC